MHNPMKTTAHTAAATLGELRSSARDGAAAADAVSTRRDPRAAPLPVHKNVSVAESCRFYGVQNAISTCRVPRSCQDCLQMPNCVLTTNGQCRDASEFTNSTNDYHNTLAQYPSGDAYDVSVLVAKNYQAHTNNFYSANATYCNESDAECSQCRASFTSLASSPRTARVLDTQFCVGEGGCVCVAVCEVPGLLPVRAYDDQCSFDRGAPSFKDPDGVDLPVFTTRRRDPRAPLSSFVLTRNGQDTCGFYDAVDIQGARQPRSCSDCLQKEGCMISLAEGEMCTSMGSYSVDLDFQSNKPNLLSEVQFLSNETSYCPASDSTCSKCRQGFSLSPAANESELYDHWSHRNKSSFCVGNGCVCIEQCEHIPDFLVEKLCVISGTPVENFVCQYHIEKDENGCHKPRSCSDCLDTQGCMLRVTSGKAWCTSDQYSSPQYDFRLEHKSFATSAVQFPSNATKYCSANDVVCAKCREYFTDNYLPVDQLPQRATYCVGEDGCVCVARCEISALFLEHATDNRYATASVRKLSDTYTIMSTVILSIVLVIFWTSWWLRDERASRQSQITEDETSWTQLMIGGLRRNMLDRAPALHLDLYGWRRYHHELRLKEEQLLAGVGEVSPVARPTPFDFASVPTAPDFDEEEESTAPTAMNPHALASAPGINGRTDQVDPLMPSAPDFE